MKRIVRIAFVLVVLCAGAIGFSLWAPNIYTEDRFITISHGERFPQIVDSLAIKGVIANRTLFEIAAKILGHTDRIQIGRYRFKSGMSNSQILEDMRYGKTVEWISVTIPEGFTATQAAARYSRYLGIDSARFVDFAGDSAFARSLGSRHGTLEGYLLPGTHKFYWQTDEAEIIKTMVDDFWKMWNDTLLQQAMRRNMTITQILALASIVEWETHIDSERPIIAGVYVNRLNRGMLLEADPTIQYVLTSGRRLLKYSDLGVHSPYNTYHHKGLPPGPVNNPGKKSILAALFPDNNKYLFFVANGKGGHTFTRTYQEHLHAVGLYRRYRDLHHTPGDAPRNSTMN